MILVVDDHADTRRVLQRLLQINGFEALTVSDGQEALSFLKENRPDAVILDDMMPHTTGLDVLRAVRSDSSLPQMPVIMYSANTSKAREREALDLGAVRWITKGADGWGLLLGTICQSLKQADVPNPGANGIAHPPLGDHSSSTFLYCDHHPTTVH